MKDNSTRIISLVILVFLGALSVILTTVSQTAPYRFLLAFYPLIVVLVGVAFLRLGSLNMAIIGYVLTVVIAISSFNTSIDGAIESTLIGLLKSLGIALTVASTMLLIYLMQETGALRTISTVIKNQVSGSEIQALYIGVGFGSFLSALGVVTPALFPPLLTTMGFSQISAISIAVLGYDATTSFSLLSIPVTLPSQLYGLNPIEFAFKITVFLPVISTGFALAILWVTGGLESIRRGIIPGLVCGLTISGVCLISALIDHSIGFEIIPIRLIGVIAGLCTMITLTIYHKLTNKTPSQVRTNHIDRQEIIRSFSPLCILTILAAIVSYPVVGDFLSKALGTIEIIKIGTTIVDLDILSQIYTWIFIATIISLFTMKPNLGQISRAFRVWLMRFPAPILTIFIFFCLSFVMSGSSINLVLGETLALTFGGAYIYVSASLGFLGAIVGGSETTSNVLFYKIQRTTADSLNLGSSGFMTIYSGHAVAGGVASAVTPSKINNAVSVVAADKETESFIMRRHLLIALILTLATCIISGLLVSLGF